MYCKKISVRTAKDELRCIANDELRYTAKDELRYTANDKMYRK